jgi:hypothetical protein
LDEVLCMHYGYWDDGIPYRPPFKAWTNKWQQQRYPPGLKVLDAGCGGGGPSFTGEPGCMGITLGQTSGYIPKCKRLGLINRFIFTANYGHFLSRRHIWCFRLWKCLLCRIKEFLRKHSGYWNQGKLVVAALVHPYRDLWWSVVEKMDGCGPLNPMQLLMSSKCFIQIRIPACRGSEHPGMSPPAFGVIYVLLPRYRDDYSSGVDRCRNRIQTKNTWSPIINTRLLKSISGIPYFSGPKV